MFEFLLFAQAGASAGIGSLSEIWQHIIADFSNITQPSQLAAFGQVLAIDLLLAGDNAIVVGALAAGLPAEDRKKVILIGIGAALVLRIFFALIVTWLLGIVGLVFAGGLLLIFGLAAVLGVSTRILQLLEMILLRKIKVYQQPPRSE